MKFLVGLVFGTLTAAAGLLLVLAVSVVSGTLLYFIWPMAIPAVIPGLVKDGIVAGALTWWQAVLTTWLFSILIKPSVSSNSKS
jgi:hypothetical protein